MLVLQVSEVHKVFQVLPVSQVHEAQPVQRVNAVLTARTVSRVLLVSQVMVMPVHEVTTVPQLLLQTFPQPLSARA
jgi:hypothetical protein